MDGMFKPLFGANDVGLAIYAFSFISNGASDPATTTRWGNKIASITYAATGVYTVTFDRSVKEITFVNAAIRDSSGSSGVGDYASVYVADDTANPLVIVIQTFDDTGTAIATTSRRISCMMVAKLSSAG